MLEIITEELKNTAAAFYEITKLKIVLYDDKRRVLYSYPPEMCEFCNCVRSSPCLAEKCIECDNVGFDICENTGKPYIYRCHMNLSEAIAPIEENGIIIGYLMLGQVMMDSDTDGIKNRIGFVSEKYSLNPDELYSKMHNIKVMDKDEVSAAVKIMSMCSCYLYVNKIIKNRSDILSQQLKYYVDTYFSDKLSVKEICGKMYISRSKLYAISKEAFGMGITDYIRLKRIKYAKELLAGSDLSVAEISEQSGFSDFNYFIRIFKKYEGVTPGRYRKIVNEENAVTI